MWSLIRPQVDYVRLRRERDPPELTTGGEDIDYDVVTVGGKEGITTDECVIGDAMCQWW